MFTLLGSRKSGLIKSCPSPLDLWANNILWSHVDWCKFCIHVRSSKIPILPHSKSQLRKIIIQIKLEGMSTTFHCTKLCFYNCNSSWVATIKQNVNFKFQLPAMSIFFTSFKNGLIKSCSSSEELSEYKMSRSYTDWCKFCIHLRIWTSAILERLQLQH
jgi:hypothetical protein